MSINAIRRIEGKGLLGEAATITRFAGMKDFITNRTLTSVILAITTVLRWRKCTQKHV